jgi:hypothetical protein
MLLLVGILGVGMAAMRDGSELAARAAFSVMLAALAVALLGAIVLRGTAPWVGFALFGGGYATLTFLPVVKAEFQPLLLTTPLLDRLIERIHNVPPDPVIPDFLIPGHSPNARGRALTPEEDVVSKDYLAKCRVRWARYEAVKHQIDSARLVGHSILALTFGLIGAILGRFLASRHASRGLSSGHEYRTETSPLTS